MIKAIIFFIFFMFTYQKVVYSNNYLEFEKLKNNYLWSNNFTNYNLTSFGSVSQYGVAYFKGFEFFYLGAGLYKTIGNNLLIISDASSNLNITYKENLRPELKTRFKLYNYQEIEFLMGASIGLQRTNLNLKKETTLKNIVQEQIVVEHMIYSGEEISVLNNNLNNNILLNICPANNLSELEDVDFTYSSMNNSITFHTDVTCKTYRTINKEVTTIKYDEDYLKMDDLFITLDLLINYNFSKMLNMGIKTSVTNVQSIKIYNNHENNIKLEGKLSPVIFSVGAVIIAKF